MEKILVDLHIHSTASDGKLAPAALAALAARQGLRIIALTDHDSVAGVAEAVAAGREHGVTVINGIEFSTRHEPDKAFMGIHILGYFMDVRHPLMLTMMEKIQSARLEQKIKQIELLQSMGFDVPVDEVLALAAGVPGRPHIASVLLARNPHRVKSWQHVFDEYLGAGKKAHVARTFALTVAEAVSLIEQVGGLPVLAHPGGYNREVNVPALVKNAVLAGVKGLEVYYPYSEEQGGGKMVARMEALAAEYGLLKTGGTDYHARNSDLAMLGQMGLTLADFERLTIRYPVR